MFIFEILRNWLVTAGGLVALLIATNTYRRNVKVKREEQARLVYSKLIDIKLHEQGATFDMLPNDAQVGINAGVTATVPPGPDDPPGTKSRSLALTPTIQITAIIHNGSKELIGPVRIQVVDTGRNFTLETFSLGVGAIDPESDFVVDFIWPNTDAPGLPGLGTTVIFRDASGSWWRRRLSEPIESVHDDPENTGPTATERVAIRAMQIREGFTPIEEPILSAKVRWHRYWRKRRGKSPIP